MMKNFMTSGSHARDKEFEEDPGGRDVMPFPEEDVVMKVYDGYPPSGRHHMSTLSPRTLSRYGWGPGDTGDGKHDSPYIYIYIYMYVCILQLFQTKKKMTGRMAWDHGSGRRPEFCPRDWCWRDAPIADALE
jgi:hypothetical protein